MREIFELILELLLLLAQAAVRIFCQQTLNRPFHFFFSTFDMGKLGKIRRHHWKDRFKMSKIVKFESDLLTTIEDIAAQCREILQTFTTTTTTI